MRLRSCSGRFLTSSIVVILVVALTCCSCVEKLFTFNSSNNNMNNPSYLGASGPGAWDVVLEALNLERQLSPSTALNDYDPFSTNPYMAAAVNYWKKLCIDICPLAMPASYQYVYQNGVNALLKCSSQAYCENGGALQCAMYVETVYALADHPLPQDDNAVDFYTNYKHIPGWEVLPVATNLPLPGDMIVWSHGSYGHVAIVVDVQPPTEGSPLGSVTVAQANGPATITTPNANLSSWVNDHAPNGTPLLQMPLQLHKGASAREDTYSTYAIGWGSGYNVLGYVRNPTLDTVNSPSGDLVRSPQWYISGDQSGFEAAAAQYDAAYPLETWGPAACSAATMTEVINAYNVYFHRVGAGGKIAQPYRIADILKVENSIIVQVKRNWTPEITSDGGLQQQGTGMVLTFAQFHFNAFWGGHDSQGTPATANALSLDQIIEIANAGVPVIVGLDQGKWGGTGGGHYMVVQGGDDKNIQFVDSSSYNYQTLDRRLFATWWSGLYIIAYPEDEPGMPTDQSIKTLFSVPEDDLGVPLGVWVQLAYMDALQADINPAYYIRQIYTESTFFVGVPDTGPNGADVGIAQASSTTIVGYNLRDPVQALSGAAKYDAKNFRMYLGSDQSPDGELEAYRKTFAAYNGGGGLVAEWINKYKSQWLTNGFCDVRNYVNHVMVGLGQNVC